MLCVVWCVVLRLPADPAVAPRYGVVDYSSFAPCVAFGVGGGDDDLCVLVLGVVAQLGQDPRLFNRARSRTSKSNNHKQQREAVMKFVKTWTPFDFTHKL